MLIEHSMTRYTLAPNGSCDAPSRDSAYSYRKFYPFHLGEVNEQNTMKSAIAEIAQTYGIENWGAGYFSINSEGHLAVHPAEGDPRSVDVKKIIDDLVARKVKLPILLRFPQLFASQVRKMNQSFRSAMR